MHSRKFCIFNKWRTQFGREVRKVIRAKERAVSADIVFTGEPLCPCSSFCFLTSWLASSSRSRPVGFSGRASLLANAGGTREGTPTPVWMGTPRTRAEEVRRCLSACIGLGTYVLHLVLSCRSIPWVCSRKKCVGGCGRCMGHLRQRQLCIVYVLAWKWEMAKRRAARTCSLKAGDGVLFDRQKDQVFHAKIKRVTPEKTYDIVYMNSSNEKRLVKACPRSRLASKGDGGHVRMPREWASAFVDLAGLVRGRRGEARNGWRAIIREPD